MSDSPDDELMQQAIARYAEGKAYVADCAQLILDRTKEEGVPASCIVILTKVVPDVARGPEGKGPGATVLYILGHAQNYGADQDLLAALQHAARMLERKLS